VQVQLLGAERQIARQYHRLTVGTMRVTIAGKRAEIRFTIASMTIVAAGMALVLGFGRAPAEVERSRRRVVPSAREPGEHCER